MVRTLQIVVIAFWLFTIGALLKTIYSPGEAGFVELDVRRPLQNFFEWNDSTRMNLYQDQRELGSLSVVAFNSAKQSRPGFSFSTTLMKEVEPHLMGAFINALFKFNEDFSLHKGAFTFKLPSQQLTTQLHTDDNNELKALVKKGDQTLFNYEGSRDGSPTPAMLGMIQGNPMAAGLLASLGQTQTDSDNENGALWGGKVKAYRGFHRINGRRLPVFLLKIEPVSQQEIRIYFTESGEPLVIESDFGIYAISEVLSVAE